MTPPSRRLPPTAGSNPRAMPLSTSRRTCCAPSTSPPSRRTRPVLRRTPRRTRPAAPPCTACRRPPRITRTSCQTILQHPRPRPRRLRRRYLCSLRIRIIMQRIPMSINNNNNSSMLWRLRFIPVMLYRRRTPTSPCMASCPWTRWRWRRHRLPSSCQGRSPSLPKLRPTSTLICHRIRPLHTLLIPWPRSARSIPRTARSSALRLRTRLLHWLWARRRRSTLLLIPARTTTVAVVLVVVVVVVLG